MMAEKKKKKKKWMKERREGAREMGGKHGVT